MKGRALPSVIIFPGIGKGVEGSANPGLNTDHFQDLKSKERNAKPDRKINFKKGY